MNYKAAISLVFFTLSNCTAIPNINGSIARTFAGFFLEMPDEPIEYFDVQEGSGSGFGMDKSKEHKHVPVKKDYQVTKETAHFLTGSLMTLFVPSVYALVFIISVPLNLLAVFTFVWRIHPRKPAVIFMLNLAVADLLFVLLLPLKMSYHFNGNNWTYGSAACSLVTAAFYCNMYCSILLMMCISVDRFLAVVYPIESLTWRSPSNATVVCVAMWLLAVAGVVPISLSNQTMHLSELGITTCHDVLDIRHLRSYYLYFFPIFCSIFFFVPLAFIVACYVRIFQALRATDDVAQLVKRRRAIFMAAAVLVVFVVCFMPTNIILLAHYVQVAKDSHGSYAAYLVSMCVGSISCCLDPLIYYFGLSQCQKQVAGILCCSFLRRSHEDPQVSSTRSTKMATFQSCQDSPYRKLTL